MGEGWFGSSALSVLAIDSSAKSITQTQRLSIPNNYFGEGVTYYPIDGLVYQLTWTNNVLLVYSGLMTNPNM